MKRTPTTILFFLLSTQILFSNTYPSNCAHCHGSEGERKALGRSMPLKDMSKEEILEKMYLYKSGKLNIHGMGGLMRSELFKIDEEHYPAIASWLSDLKKEKE
jgi:cytochrome c553